MKNVSSHYVVDVAVEYPGTCMIIFNYKSVAASTIATIREFQLFLSTSWVF